ncbi:MAG TPA: hypothetical protein VMO47_02525, partial [Rhodothermales bacterium]|nr:hypothetical protein [Rhodothermales bacterium]
SLGASLTANLPSGKRELSRDEFQTSVLLSQNMFDFRVPVLGQGLNLAPGLTWATPLGETLVVGIGLAYHYRGAFTPLDDGLSYDPGDEILVTGGLNVAIADLWSLAGDVSFAHYQMDTVEGTDRYQSGSKISTTVQLRRPFGENDLRILARYRTRAPGELPAAGGLVSEEERMVPDQMLGHLSFRMRGSRSAYLTLLGQARLFNETSVFPATTVFDVGAVPEYAINEDWSLLLRFVYTLGDFSGFEGGVGIAAQL